MREGVEVRPLSKKPRGLCSFQHTQQHFTDLEFANIEQKEVLLDMIIEMDRFRQCLPRDRFALEQASNIFTMQVTGRLPPTSL